MVDLLARENADGFVTHATTAALRRVLEIACARAMVDDNGHLPWPYSDAPCFITATEARWLSTFLWLQEQGLLFSPSK